MASTSSTSSSTFTSSIGKPGDMLAQQDSLPPLPLPSLEDTLGKLLRSIRAVTSDEEYAHSEAVVREFVSSGAGPKLQQMLEERASTHRNWLEEWWEEFIYLRPRYPIATWISWGGASPTIDWSPFPSVTQVEAAATYTQHLLAFRELVLNGSLTPDTLAGRPLCMWQYTRMFNSCRVPHKDKDEVVVYPITHSNHIVVLRNDLAVKLRVLDDEGKALPFADLVAGMERAIEMTSSLFDLDPISAVSVLTTEDRDVWAAEREHLLSLSQTNADNLEAIESAIFLVSLERDSPVSLHDRVCEALFGRRGSGRGIWFDKPLHTIVFANGLAAINGEHTWADAMVVVRQQDWMVRSIREEWSKKGKPKSGPTSSSYLPPTFLPWTLDVKAKEAIERASSKIATLNSTIGVEVLEFPHFGAGLCKRHKLTPDFFMQMAIQLAYFRWSGGKSTATYETGHTRLFFHGRTETVRSCSNESINFCRMMEKRQAVVAAVAAAAGASSSSSSPSSSPSATECVAALRTAVAAHSATVKDALTGHGIDRHLLGLQVVAQMTAAGMGGGEASPLPSLFSDAGYLRSKKYLLSTSNVSVGGSRTFGGYSPFFPGGYGVCYGIQEGSINVCISHVKGSGTDAEAMKRSLSKALMDMQALLGEEEVAEGAGAGGKGNGEGNGAATAKL